MEKYITMISYECWGISNQRKLKCLFNRLFRLPTEEMRSPASLAHMRGTHNWHGLLAQRAIVVESIFLFSECDVHTKCFQGITRGHNNYGYRDGLVQERRNSSALAMELQLSCTNPLTYTCTCFDKLDKHWVRYCLDTTWSNKPLLDVIMTLNLWNKIQ